MCFSAREPQCNLLCATHRLHTREKGGAAGGWINLLESNPPLNHRCDISAGVLQEECVALLQSFFREARDRKKAERDLIRKQAEEG